MKKLMAFVIVLVCALGLFACKSDKQDNTNLIPESSVATFEYKEDTGYKLITGEIGSLDSFNSLLLKQSDTEFKGEWVYRIVFNPEKYSKYKEEVIVLFGEECVSINGVTYIAEDQVSYSDILSWAEVKYAFFDYELIID